MNASSVMVMIVVLSFAADRVARAIMIMLRLLPRWRRWFPDPLNFPKDDLLGRARAKRKLDIAYTLVVGAIAAAAVLAFPELTIVSKLAGPTMPEIIDAAVTIIVVMGGSELVSRLMQISGVSDIPISPTAQHAMGGAKNEPIEISGRLVLESDPLR